MYKHWLCVVSIQHGINKLWELSAKCLASNLAVNTVTNGLKTVKRHQTETRQGREKKTHTRTSLRAISKFWAQEGWQENSVLWTQSYGVTCEPYSYIALSALCMWTDTLLCIPGEKLHHAENIRGQHTKLSRPRFVLPLHWKIKTDAMTWQTIMNTNLIECLLDLILGKSQAIQELSSTRENDSTGTPHNQGYSA